jgi:nicotinamide-nucleotide amidase
MVIDERIGDFAVTRLAREVAAACMKRQLFVTTAESCTGGGVAEALTRIPGSTRYFERGFVTYGNDAKEDLLGVSHATLLAHGAVSEETAREMAEGALARSSAGLSVAITGIAGPGGGGARQARGARLVRVGAAGRAHAVEGDRLQGRARARAQAGRGRGAAGLHRPDALTCLSLGR